MGGGLTAFVCLCVCVRERVCVGGEGAFIFLLLHRQLNIHMHANCSYRQCGVAGMNLYCYYEEKNSHCSRQPEWLHTHTQTHTHFDISSDFLHIFTQAQTVTVKCK